MRRPIVTFLAVLVLLAIGVTAGRWLGGRFRAGVSSAPHETITPASQDATAIRAVATRATSRPLVVRPGEPSWAIFRGDRALTGQFNVSIAPPLQAKWRFVAKGAVKSSPVLWAGRAFFGSNDGNVYCLDAADGSLIWKVETGQPIEAPPLLLDGHVIIGLADGSLLCLSAEGGSEVWRYKAADKIVGSANWFDHQTAGRCVVFGSYDNSLHCLSAGNGGLIWKYQTENYVNGTPAIFGEIAAIGGCDGKVHVVNLRSGQAERRIDAGKYIAASPAIVETIAYIGNHDDAFDALDLRPGEAQGAAPLWEVKSDRGGYYASAAVAGQRVVTAGLDGAVTCLQRKDGTPLWTFTTDSAIDASPVVAGDTVIVAGGDGKLYLLSLENGQKLGEFNAGSAMTATPAVGENLIVIGCDDGSVYGLVH